MRDITLLVLLLVPLGSAASAPGPPQNLTLVNRTCHSITFQWSPPDDTGGMNVTGYDILHNGTSVANITGTVYTLEGLTPDTVHTISVRTRNAIGPSVQERTLTAKTAQRDSVQGKVTEIAGSTSDRLLLSHSEAQTTYRCLLSADRLESMSVNVTRGIIIVDTQPDTAYNITCLGYDNQGRDLCRKQNMSIITRPSKVEGVMFGNNVVKNGRIHQEIKWTALVLRHNAKPQYTIRYANDSSKVLSDGKFKFSSEPNTTLQLTFGSSNITYYAVVAVRQTGEQERGDFSDPVSIAYTNPGPPQDLTRVNRTCHSITFQWSPPGDTGRLDVTGYDILHNGTSVATITGTVYTLEGLTPDTVHTISVRTRNAIGPSVLWRTLTRASEGRAQVKVTAVSVSSHNLTLRHEAQVTYRCLLSARGLESVSVDVPSGETVTVTVLPDTMYTIGCVGYGEQGQELCVEGNITITTRLPKVKNVMFGNNTVVNNVIWQNITWSAVQLPNDDPTYYIQYNTSTNRDTMLTTAVSSPNSHTLKLKIPSFNTTLTVWIITTRTFRNQATPSDPKSITYTTPGPPQDLTLVNRTCHSITYQWSPPDDTGRLDVTGYDILHNGALVATITGTVYTLEGLTPDTVHTISVRTRNAIGPSVLERTLTTATTQRDSVKEKITADSVSSQSLTLNHSEAQVTYRCLLSAEGLESVSVNVTSRTVTVARTQPDTAYNITCVGYDNQGRDLCREQNTSIITPPPEPTAPGPPQNLTLVNRTCHSITFQWSPPDDTGRLDVTGYDIQHNGAPVANITGTVYTLEVLTPDTVHTISVRTRNTIGPSVLETTLTAATEGRVQSNVTAASVSSHNLTLRHEAQVTSWCLLSAQGLQSVSVNVASGETVTVTVVPDTMYTIGCVGYGEQGQDLCVEGNMTITTRPPKVKNVTFGRTRVVSNMIWQDISWNTVQLRNDVTKYLIKSYSSRRTATAQSNATSYTLKLKVPTSNTTFTVWVAAIRNRAVRDQGDPSDPQSITYTTPGPPQDLTLVNRTCHSITFQWSPPGDTGRLDVTGYDILHNGTPVATTTGTVYTLEGLTPDTVHTISVRTRNAIGPSVVERTLTNATKQQHSVQGKVTADSVSSHNLTLSHRETQVTYRCLLSAQRLEPVSVNVTRGTVTVVHTQPDTAYNITCLEYDNQGRDLCREQSMSIITPPSKVEGVVFGNNKVKNGKIHQEVKWNVPALRYNKFPKYIIRYSERNPDLFRRKTEFEYSSEPNTTLHLNYGTTNITYYVVVAVRSAGKQKRGDYSDPVNITYTTPGPPKDMTLVNRTCHSITFQWSPPDDTGRLDVTGYVILHNGTSVATITGTVYTLEGLTPDTVHTISVRTRNAIESSVMVATLTAATGGRAKPLMVTAETISSKSIGIGVSPPNQQTGRLHYKCNLTTETSDSVQMLSLNDTRNNSPYSAVKGLSSYTNYTATCLVLKDGVDQCYIGSDTTQTYTDRPSASPRNVSIVSTSSHSFTMMWAPPPKMQQNGEIVSYEVEYREEGSNSTVVNTSQGMRYTAEDLTTDRVYQFRVTANTVNGTGPFSEWENVTTIPTVNLRAVNTTTSSATITWDQPPHNYRVFLHGEATDNIPQSRVIQLVDVTGQTTHIVEGLNSFRNYRIGVYLESDLGRGNNATVTFQTFGRAPDSSPTHLRATPTSRSVTLQWSPPPVLSRNGILTHYVVGLANETWNTTQSHRTTGEQRKRREADSEGVGEETQSLTVGHLRPFTNYTWEVAAVSGFGAGPSTNKMNFETDQDVPTQVENITVNPDEKTITWAAPAEPNGIIVGYRVQYWELGRRDTTVEANTTAAEELVFSYSNFSAGVPHKVQVQAATVAGLGEGRVVEEVLFSEEQAPYKPVSDITVTRVNDTAVRITWTTLTLNDARGFPSYVVNVTIGGMEVSTHSTNSTSVVVGGLMPHTEYNVTVQALTAGGTKGGPLSEPVTIEALPEPTDGSSSPLTWILVVLIVVLIVAVVIFTVVAVVICRRYRSRNKTKPAGLWKDIPMKERGVLQEGIHAPLDLGPITDPEDRIQRKEAVLKENFCEHVQKLHQDKNALFVAEYQSITQTPEGVCDSAFKANVIKNRYVNIFSYDHSRVVLTERDSTGSDYINGAYIDAYNRANGYIATQGPTPDTLDDFWQMVWEHHAPVIVMLTKLIEKNKRKCERYWTTELNEPFKPGRNLSVTILRCDTHPEFELRTIKVEKLTSKEDPLEVKHFLYTAWPDHGVPQYSVSIHRFIRQHVRPVYNDSSAPLIVHCSAGAGRTGTYMAIDTMMYQLEDRQNANIFEYVERMRTRRTQMVQNASQYIYIHDAINDYINCKDTTIVAHELRPRIEEMRQIDITTGSSGFVTQFSLLAEVSIKQCDADYAFAEEEDIMSKNRYRGLCPFSDKHLTKEDDSYINASEISGYCGQRNFIAAQTPMRNTEGDVWEMIWMEKCAAVVVLCKFVEENDEMCSKFWPLKMSEPKTFGSIKVCLDDKVEQASYNEYHLTVSFTNHPDPLKVVVFHYLQWPRHGRPSIPPYLQLMGEVERSQHNATGPTLVMCDDGMSRTGVFITTMAEVERVKVQGEVDIFQTVKAARSERPHMVSTPVDYEVCHDVLVSYLESFDTYANFK